jgi:hypothetical protein
MGADEIVRVHLSPVFASVAFHDDKIIGFAGIRERFDRL